MGLIQNIGQTLWESKANEEEEKSTKKGCELCVFFLAFPSHLG